MKRLMKAFLLPVLVLVSLNATAQTVSRTEVPEAVVQVIEAKYPTADIEWEIEGENYEAEMEIEGLEVSVMLDRHGKLLETEQEVNAEDLPEATRTYLNTNFPRKKIKEAEQITDLNGNVYYEVEIDDYNYIFDSNGAFVKREDEKVKDPGKH